MKSFFLAQIGRQLFGVEKSYVRGVSVGKAGKRAPEGRGSGTILPLADGNQAVFCDLYELMSGPVSWRNRQESSLILRSDGRFLVLAMSGRGRMAMVDEAACKPLPPAFPDDCRSLVPKALINGGDLVLMLDVSALLDAVAPDRERDNRDESAADLPQDGIEGEGRDDH